MRIKDVSAHCDIPCAVYDPGVAQYAALLEELKKIKNIPIKKLEELYEFFNS